MFRHIDEVAPGEWDCLLDPDDLQATHRFVKACQDSGVEQAEYRHVLVRRAGLLQATATLCAMRVPLDVLATGAARRLVASVRRVRRQALHVPVLFCGLPVSFGRSCLRLAPGADPSEVLTSLCKVAERFAQETGARVVCFKEFTADEATALAPLTEMGYFRAPSLPSCRLELGWRSFEEYAGAMRAGYRRQLRATLRSRDAHGLTVRVLEDYGHECRRIHALYEQVIERAEFRLERLPVEFFERLSALLAAESRAILVEHGGRLIAAAIVLDGPTVSTFLLVGLEYELLRALDAYHVVLAEVVAHAVRRGARALEMGQTSYELKTRLGGRPTTRELFVRYRSPIGHQILRRARGALFPSVQVPARRVFRDE